MQNSNLPDLFFSISAQNPEEIACSFKNKETETNYNYLSWENMSNQIKNISAHLNQINLKKGDGIGILSNTRLEWTLADIASMALGLVSFSFYHTCSLDELIYLLKDSQIKFLFLEDKKQLHKLIQIQDKIQDTNLQGICLFEELEPEFKEKVGIPVYQISTFIKENLEINIKSFYETIKPEDIATVVYTSGTSGQLKGVVLTHNHILKQMQAIEDRVQIKHTHTLLAFLTNAHIFQRIAGQWYFISQGQSICYCKRIERVSQYLQDSNATIILAVPLLLEKIKIKILNGIDELPQKQKEIIKFALNTAIELKRMEYSARSKTIKSIAKASHKLIYDTILYKLRDKLSKTLKAIVSGGAPISSNTILFYRALSIDLIEGYGLTETTAIIAANSKDSFQIGSVGKPLKGVNVKIAEDDEILTSGDTIFEKYWQNEEAAREAFDGHWFKTGDLGKLDENNNLYIIGRKKDLIINAGGKKISPALIEEALKPSNYVEQIAVFGDKQKWLAALITLQKIPVLQFLFKEDWENKIHSTNWTEISNSKQVKELIESELNKFCNHLAEHEKIRKFIILPEPFRQERDELTHTMKLKRRIIEKNYKKEIDILFL